MRARLYHPRLGRFTSPDPWPAYLPEPVTLNRYVYALADPIGQVDPLGLFCWTGKSHGKCRGLRDVVERVSQPLSNIATVAGAVAVVSAGVVVLCPSCGIAGFSAMAISEAAGTAALWSGLMATGSKCVKAGTIADFDCAVGLATSALTRPVPSLAQAAGPALGFMDDVPIFKTGATYKAAATFGTRIFGLLVKGSTSTGKALRREK